VRVSEEREPLFYIKIINPQESDKEYAQYLLKEYRSDVPEDKLRPNMELIKPIQSNPVRCRGTWTPRKGSVI
jgi:hypothetical protein